MELAQANWGMPYVVNLLNDTEKKQDVSILGDIDAMRNFLKMDGSVEINGVKISTPEVIGFTYYEMLIGFEKRRFNVGAVYVSSAEKQIFERLSLVRNVNAAEERNLIRHYSSGQISLNTMNQKNDDGSINFFQINKEVRIEYSLLPKTHAQVFLYPADADVCAELNKNFEKEPNNTNL